MTAPPAKRAALDLALYAPPAAAPAAPASFVLERGHSAAVTAVAFSPSSRLLACASKDRTVSLWDAAGAFANVLTLRAAHGAGVTGVAFLSDAALATASADRTLATWDAETGARLRRFGGAAAIVNDVAAAGAGAPDAFASVDDAGALALFDARARAPALVVETGAPLLGVALAPDGATLFAGGAGAAVLAYDARRPAAPLFSLEGAPDTITSLALSPGATHVAALSADGTARAFDVRPFCAGARAGAVFAGAPPNADLTRLAVAWSPDGGTVAAGAGDGAVRLWDADSGALRAALPGHGGACAAVAFAPDGRLATGGTDKRVFVGPPG